MHNKKQFIFLMQVILFLLIAGLPFLFAETIILKSGRQIEGRIIEKTEQYIKIEIEGILLTYWLDEIERIEGLAPIPGQDIIPRPSQEVTIKPFLTDEPYDLSKYFPMDIGNRWVYQSFTLEGEEFLESTMIISVKSKEILDSKEIYLFESVFNGKRPLIFYYILDKEGIYLYKMVLENGYSNIFSPPLLVFPKNVRLGQGSNLSTLIKTYDANDNLADEGTIEIKGEVEKVENITVPAGKFENCLKVSSSATVRSKKKSMFVIRSIWFAPGVGKIKEVEDIISYEEETKRSHSEIELKNAMIKEQKIGA